MTYLALPTIPALPRLPRDSTLRPRRGHMLSRSPGAFDFSCLFLSFFSFSLVHFCSATTLPPSSNHGQEIPRTDVQWPCQRSHNLRVSVSLALSWTFLVPRRILTMGDSHTTKDSMLIFLHFPLSILDLRVSSRCMLHRHSSSMPR